MKDMDKIIRILGKAVIIFLIINIGYWGNYFYGEMKENRETKKHYEEFNKKELSPITRGGYAQPSRRDSIPNTLRPDTLR